MKHPVLSVLALIGLVGAPFAVVLKADPQYKRTEVTFHSPVAIPGKVLLPGTYVIKLLDPYMERSVVRFYNEQENHMYAMVFAIPDYRVTAVDHSVLTFEERGPNAPEALKEWFPAGENWGAEFVYAKPAAPAAPAAPPQLEPRPIALAPRPVPEAAASPAPAPAANAAPQPPVEIAQVRPAPTPAPAPAAAPVAPAKELPKTASDLPAMALFGGALLLAGAVLRKRPA